MFKKLMITLLSGVILLGTNGSISAMASVANVIEPQGQVSYCPRCNDGIVKYNPIDRKYDGQGVAKCAHGKMGSDLCDVYVVKKKGACNHCDYTIYHEYKEFIPVKCMGKSN